MNSNRTTGILIAATTISLVVSGCRAPADHSIPATAHTSKHATAQPTFRPPVHNEPHMDLDASCDKHGKAYNVKPNTKAARAKANEMCANLHRSLQDVGWVD